MASIINASNTGFGGIVSTGDSSGQLQLQTAGTTAVTLDTSQNATFAGKVTSAGALTLASNGSTTAVTIDTSQNVNIPAGYLFVGAGATNYGNIYLNSTTTYNPQIRENSGAMAFATGNSERMRIDSSGNVLVGKTSQIVDELFGVDQTASSRPAIIARAATTGSPAFKTVKTTNVNNTTQYHITFSYNNGANGNGAIVGNGDSQAAFATFSDSRLKKNIEDLPSQLDKITALRPVEFDYIKSNEHQIGFIAQEVQTVYPDLVATGQSVTVPSGQRWVVL